ncbi:hypothetical protein DFS34DRAFT_616522 [Phlyctochytrium arcticum]|nr:hypothetical protein DFS34DRAFT_616522 [Phlyctochytrium arcticum]
MGREAHDGWILKGLQPSCFLLRYILSRFPSKNRITTKTSVMTSSILCTNCQKLKDDLREERRLFQCYQETSQEYDNEMQLQVQQLQRRVQKLQKQSEEAKKDAQAWHARWREEKDAAEARIAEALTEVGLMKEKKNHYKRQSWDLELENESLNRSVRVLQDSISELAEENARLKKEQEVNHQLFEQAEQYKEKMRDLETELTELRGRDRTLGASNLWRDTASIKTSRSVSNSPTAVLLQSYGITMSRTNSAEWSSTTLHDPTAPPIPAIMPILNRKATSVGTGRKTSSPHATARSLSFGEEFVRFDTVEFHESTTDSRTSSETGIGRVLRTVAHLPSKGRRQTQKVKRYLSVKCNNIRASIVPNKVHVQKQ